MAERPALPDCPTCGTFLLPSEHERAVYLERVWRVDPLWARVCGACARRYAVRGRDRLARMAAGSAVALPLWAQQLMTEGGTAL